MHFQFDRDHINFFLSSEASEIRMEYRKQAEKYADSLRIQTSIRSQWSDLPPTLIAACMEQFSMQERGARKCDLPANALYTGPALEMASSAAAASLHASLLPQQSRILEIAAGIGADSIALARRASALASIEANEVHAKILRHNLDVAGHRNALVLRGRAEDLMPALRLQAFDAIFADPARRSSTQRSTGSRSRNIDVEDYSPPFSFFDALPHKLPILIKIAPAAEAPAGWGVIAVSAGGECKELLLHRNLGLPPLCAMNADSGERWVPEAETRRAIEPESPAWLIEPHGAIIRTGAVAAYCREQGCEPLDPMIAYGWSDHEPPHASWHQRFQILRVEKFNRKGLQRSVKELGFSSGTEIKKRGFPDTPDVIRARLKFTGNRNGVIILTRRGDGHLMIFGVRPSSQGEE